MSIKETNVKMLPIGQLVTNDGQIEGVPANPRQINKTDFEKLKASLRANDLTGVMPLKVYPQGGQYVVLGGNMRLRALQELGAAEVSCIVLPENTDVETLREVVIVDNSTFGEWDIDSLADQWDESELRDWGVDLPFGKDTETSKLSEIKINSMYHEPQEHPRLTLEQCVDMTKYNAKMDALRQMDLTEKQLQVLELFARRFIRIDFESVANYYAFSATDTEKDAIERLRLVLIDGGGQGFIEDELLRVRNELLKDGEDEE